MALTELVGLYEPINILEALLGDFGDFDFRHETLFSTQTQMINFQVFFELRRQKIFLGFSRNVLIKTFRLSYRLSNLVVWDTHRGSLKSSVSFKK